VATPFEATVPQEAGEIFRRDALLSHAPRVLVIGEELMQLLGAEAQEFARSAGFRLTRAPTGAEGLRELLNHRQAVVLVSDHLPDIAPGLLLEQLPLLTPETLVATTLPPSAAGVPEATATAHRRVWLKPPLTAELLQATILRMVQEAASIISEHSARILHSLNHIEDIIIDPARSEHALGEICQELLKLTGADAIALFLPAAEDPGLLLTSCQALSAACQQQLTRAAEQGFSHLVRQHVTPPPSPRLFAPPDQASLPLNTPFVALLNVPLLTEHAIKGVLCAAFTTAEARARCPVPTLFHLANHAVHIYQEVSHTRNLAARDVLTGLYNRNMFTETLNQTFSIAVRKGAPVGLLLFDFDNLKSVNDQHGHLIGDRILREAATLTLATARTSDIVARFGGDEFAVILPETSLADAQRAAERLLTAFRERQFGAPSHKIRVTLSIGVAATATAHEFHSQNLLAQADEGLLHAKRSGKNRCSIAPSVSEAASPTPPAATQASSLRGRVLILDDDPSVRQLLTKMLGLMKFEITACSTLPEALQAIEASSADFDLVMTDLHLGNGTGIDLLQALKNKAPLTIKMVVSAYASKGTAIECLRHGAFDFVEKPFSFVQLEAAISRAMQHRQLLMSNRQYQTQLEQLVRSRSESLAHALETLRRSYSQTIQTLALMIDAREVNTGMHCRMSREAARVLARQMKLSHHDCETLEMGAVLHDIGKLGIPDAVLQKPGALTPDEQAVMRRHPVIGSDLLKSVPFLHEVAEIVLQHHEAFNGCGYPEGRQGDQICLGARVFAIIDAYHAMRSSRCYRPAMSEDAACSEISRCAGQQFDPAVVAAFLACRAEIEAVFAAGEAAARHEDESRIPTLP
jgi:diguanylate cyclase (GGDEF)-like protein/putative nucleotidyltransferase with HDIG domain